MASSMHNSKMSWIGQRWEDNVEEPTIWLVMDPSLNDHQMLLGKEARHNHLSILITLHLHLIIDCLEVNIRWTWHYFFELWMMCVQMILLKWYWNNWGFPPSRNVLFHYTCLHMVWLHMLNMNVACYLRVWQENHFTINLGWLLVQLFDATLSMVGVIKKMRIKFCIKCSCTYRLYALGLGKMSCAWER
jgi:hypothetical protein